MSYKLLLIYKRSAMFNIKLIVKYMVCYGLILIVLIRLDTSKITKIF